MFENVFAMSGSVVNVGVASFSTGIELNGLPSADWVSGLVMKLTNLSAASWFFVFLKTERLIPAMKLATGLPAAGAGIGTTPYWLGSMPSAVRFASALFWLKIIAAVPLAKFAIDSVPVLYCASAGSAILSVCIRAR